MYLKINVCLWGGGGGERGEEREKKDKEKKIQKETNGNKSSTIWINFYLHMYEGGGGWVNMTPAPWLGFNFKSLLYWHQDKY